MWKLRARPFRGLEDMGLGLMELCALYFSRTLLTTLGRHTVRGRSGTRVLRRSNARCRRRCRRFLDELPRMLKAKPRGRKKHDDRRLREVLARVLDATLLHRRAEMRYASAVVAADEGVRRRAAAHRLRGRRDLPGGVGAGVVEMRTFAAERIETFGLTDEKFAPRRCRRAVRAIRSASTPAQPETIVLEFDAAAAPFVREREWHKSQVIEDARDGGVVLTLTVCNDYALRAWILGFGPDVRVVSPASWRRRSMTPPAGRGGSTRVIVQSRGSRCSRCAKRGELTARRAAPSSPSWSRPPR